MTSLVLLLLVDGLGSDSFDTREAAQALLRPFAVPHWSYIREQSVTHPDPEVRYRLRQLWKPATLAVARSLLPGTHWPPYTAYTSPDGNNRLVPNWEAYQLWDWGKSRLTRTLAIVYLTDTGDTDGLKRSLEEAWVLYGGSHNGTLPLTDIPKDIRK